MKELNFLLSFGKGLSRCSRGFSLIEAMMAVGLLGVIGYLATSLFSSSLKSATQSNVSVQADTFKRNLINNLSNDGAWANTVAKNPSLSCLLPLYPAAPAQPGAATCTPNPTTISKIIVQNAGPAGGTTVYDNSSPLNGFNSSGALCSGFSATGNDQCPFQMNLSVTLSCPAPATTCTNPQVKVKGVLSYSPVNQAFQVALNTSKYGFDFIRGQGMGGGDSGSGTVNYLTMWQGTASPSSTLADSIVFQNGTSGIGIGTSQVTALSMLDVSGSVSIGSYAGVTAAPANGMIISGNVGIGTTSPGTNLDVNGGIHPGSKTVGSSCTGTPPGTFAYDASLDAPVYCSSTSSKWAPVGGGTIVFSVQLGTPQSIAGGTATVVSYDQISYDTINAYSTVTHRFQPNIPGKYLITASAGIRSKGSSNWVDVLIRKNGSIASSEGQAISTAGGQGLFGTTSYLVVMNGTTDYVEGVVAVDSANTLLNTNNTQMTGILIQGF